MKATGILFFIMLWLTAITASAQNNLPAQATSFIQKHYPNTSISNSKKDGNEWDVYLSNGTKLEFNAQGTIKEIEGNGALVPASVLPNNAASYLKSNYAGQTIKEIEFEDNKIEVDLANGTEVEFDREGNFLKVDN